MIKRYVLAICCWCWCTTDLHATAEQVQEVAAELQHPLAGTRQLDETGDLAAKMVAGIDQFLLKQIANVSRQRRTNWAVNTRSPQERAEFIAAKRQSLRKMLGERNRRISHPQFKQFVAPKAAASYAESAAFRVYDVTWPVLHYPGPRWPNSVSIHGRGLLLVPRTPPAAFIISIPDADQSPEQLVGLVPGLPLSAQYPRRLAQSGCAVLIPAIVSREVRSRNGRAKLTHREYLYRSGFVLGHHLLGYEVETALAGHAALQHMFKNTPNVPTAMLGYGEGGLVTVLAAVLEPSIDRVGVAGYFAPREECWQEPISRNLFGRLRAFGDAELISLILPRQVVIDSTQFPDATIQGQGAAPAKLTRPSAAAISREFAAARTLALRLHQSLPQDLKLKLIEPPPEQKDMPFAFGEEALKSLFPNIPISSLQNLAPIRLTEQKPRLEIRQEILVEEIDRHHQWVLEESEYVRDEFMKHIKTNSLVDYEKSIEPYRVQFAQDIIGEFSQQFKSTNPRTRLRWTSRHWQAWEVQLDVFEDVVANGVLLVPRGISIDEKRPVVVCQHGLEGRPTDTFLGDHRAYHNYAARLADRGFVVFCPQNPYLFQDKFRTLQRKANTIGCTLFSIMVPQHEQITRWLGSLPFVDPKRIGFYGLSYGGKSAMRIPALVKNYSLSICSADFNEWVWKNASTRAKYSYVWTGEYEIFEFNLGGTFNYAEMAALIAPRPFMVERGHFDGVSNDQRVAYEFAKVRHLYQARLGVGDRCEIEWFVGPHTIHGQATFEFLHRHLKWPHVQPTPEAQRGSKK